MNNSLRTAKTNANLLPIERRLRAVQFQELAEVPATAEWFANLDNPRTRKAYQGDLSDFCQFIGLNGPEQFRDVTRAHVLAWRATLEGRALSGATIRRKLARCQRRRRRQSSAWGEAPEN
jgi:hypothetical protein